MSTKTKKTKYYNGRLSYEKINFIQSLNTTNLKEIQRAFKKEYGDLIRESTIERNLNKRITKVNHVEKRDFTKFPKITVEFDGEYYTMKEFSNKIAFDIIMSELMSD